MKGAFILRGLVLLVIVAYPLGVYFGLKVMPPSFLGLVLAVLIALRFGIITAQERKILMPLLLAFLTFAITAAVLGSEKILLFYPVLVNASLFVMFAWTLRSGEPLLLRMVRARGMKMSQYGPAYLYYLTMIWAGFFLINGAIAAWTTTQSLETWTVYNGLIAYLLIGSLIGAEWLFRIYYKKRKGVYKV